VAARKPLARLRLDGSEPCRGRHDLFFPDRTKPASRKLIAQAVAMCEACHQMDACREVGVANREPDGVWGGVDLFQMNGPEAWQARRRARDRAARAKKD